MWPAQALATVAESVPPRSPSTKVIVPYKLMVCEKLDAVECPPEVYIKQLHGAKVKVLPVLTVKTLLSPEII